MVESIVAVIGWKGFKQSIGISKRCTPWEEAIDKIITYDD